MKTLVVLGAALAVIACSSKKSGMKPASPAPAAIDAGPLPASPRQRIDELDKKIDDDLAQLAIPRPPAPAMSDMAPTVAVVKPTTDPTCKPGTSQTCTDSCKLADSICDNAAKICEIAAELGDDAYAKGKCGSGRASCDAARGRCCGCT